MKITYRPEIDGLRAIAVIAVIFYHAKISLFDYFIFQGGFIGVDIFFVVSGYLITSLILKEITLEGKFSFFNFYVRRARRILPVLLLVMIVTLPFAWFILLPANFYDLSKSILYSLIFSSNHYFHLSGQIYGADISYLRPFLHNWSLSVEEQFYIIFPIFLIIFYKYFRKYLSYLIILGIFLGIFISDWGARHHPLFTFYMLPTRGWELLSGVLLANLENDYGRFPKKILTLPLSIIGLILIGYSIFFYKDNMLHPSYYTFFPILGTCLIIWFANKKIIITKLFSTKLFVGIGLISYSLYLWHYPVLTLSKIFEFSSGIVFNKTLLIFFILLLSLFSYFLIERPFRNKKIISLKLFFLIIFCFLIFVSSINFFVIYKKGFKKRFNDKFAINGVNIENEVYKDEWIKFSNNNNSLSFREYNLKNVLIIGNSHGQDLFNAFKINENLFKEYEFIFWYKQLKCLGMLAYDDSNKLVDTRKPSDDIKKYINTGVYCGEKKSFQLRLKEKEIKDFNNADIILLSTKWYEEDKETIDKILIELKKTNKTIILGTTSPEFLGFSTLTIIDRFLLQNKRMPKKHELEKIKEEYYKVYVKDKIAQSTNYLIKKLADKYNLKILDRSLYSCDRKNNVCDIFTDNNKKIYWDREHYTLEGAKYFGKKIYKMNLLKYN